MPIGLNLPNLRSTPRWVNPRSVGNVKPRRQFSKGIQAKAGRVRYALAVNISDLSPSVYRAPWMQLRVLTVTESRQGLGAQSFQHHLLALPSASAPLHGQYSVVNCQKPQAIAGVATALKMGYRKIHPEASSMLGYGPCTKHSR